MMMVYQTLCQIMRRDEGGNHFNVYGSVENNVKTIVTISGIEKAPKQIWQRQNMP